MHRLIYYEVGKIWHKRSFILSICTLLILNILLLWYVNIPNDEEPPLSSYKSFQNTVAEMSETEKMDYISNLKETIDGVYFVQEVLDMQNLQNEKGNILAEQALSANPDTFEKYFEVYQSGEYLLFTNSLWQEKDFIDELYTEQQKVAGYNEYLKSIQENENNLNGISIFGKQDENSFATRNIEKSAEDYSKLTDNDIRWMPSKALSISMESIWTDLFLILSNFLFVGNMIFEEKEKKLFYITRCTKNGHFQSICSKLIALFIHCTSITFLLYGVNLIFAEMAVGFGDLTADIQSVSAYMESNLSISILEYILCSALTKSVVLFSAGTILTALCIFTDNIFLPFITGFSFYGISYILYLMMPAVEKNSFFKYINLIGLMKTENLYGSYLNFNVLEYPISRLSFSWGVIASLVAVGVIASVLLFVYGNSFELRKRQSKHQKLFRPHASLLRYESYKIMITNRAIAIILLFGLLIGYRIISQEYTPSVQEQYYQDIMMQLEGEITNEKEALILSEQERYDEAFSEIDRIDDLIANGEISESAGDNLKGKWYAVTYFYPSFERVLQQYHRICESGGNFIYDTGYLYLFGRMTNDYLIDLLLLSLCIVIAFGNTVAMEYQCGSWYLLSTTYKGKEKIICKKAIVCIIATMVLSVIPIICRIINVSSTYPLHGLDFAITDIPCYQHLSLTVPIWFFIILLLLSQMVSLIAVVLIVLAISYWRKNHIQTIFFAILILVIPLILKLLGFSFAGWFSVYPIYSLTATIS